MSGIFDGLTDTRKQTDPQPLQKAVVAFGGVTTDVAILWCTSWLKSDIEDSMIGSEDVFEHGEGNNPNHGIWIWEGYIKGHTYPATPDHAEEYDVTYEGKWRPPTEKEWEAIRIGKNPFPPESPSDGIIPEPEETPAEHRKRLEDSLHNLWHEHDILKTRVGQMEAARELESEGKTLDDLWRKGE